MKETTPPVSDVDRRQNELLAKALGLTLEQLEAKATLGSNVVGSAGVIEERRPRPVTNQAAPAA